MTKLESGAARVLIQADRLDQIHCKKKRHKKKKEEEEEETMNARMLGKDSLVASSEPADLKNSWSGLFPATGVEIAVYGRGASAPFWLKALIACFRVLSGMEEAPQCRAVITDISAKSLKLCLINEHASGSGWHSFHFSP